MRIDDLKTFVEVAKSESMSKAADTLHLGQSNITMKIKRLEEYYRTNLFVRTSRGVYLTSDGKLFFERVVPLLKEWDQLNDIMFDTKMHGELTLGSMETTAAIRLPSLISDLHQLYPDVTIHLETGNTEQILKRLLHYKIDAGFIAGPIQESGVKTFPIFRENLVLITSKQLGEELDKTYSQLKSQTILTFKTGCSYRWLLEKFLKEYSFTPLRRMEFGSIEAIIGCVKNGMGISILPHSVVKNHDDISIHMLPPAYRTVDTQFVYRENEWPTLFNFFKEYSLKSY